MIWGSEDRDPRDKDDVIRNEMNCGARTYDEFKTLSELNPEMFDAMQPQTITVIDPESGEEVNAAPDNPLLDEVLNFYDCYDLLPQAQRIIWLASLKEVCGIIPLNIDVDYEELRLLVILNEEQNKKMAIENFKMRQESKRSAASLDSMQ
jgi:hypothetical protein